MTLETLWILTNLIAEGDEEEVSAILGFASTLIVRGINPAAKSIMSLINELIDAIVASKNQDLRLIS
jgi:hypothetical protein